MIQRSLAKKRSGEGGFTLVELLIVIVILGILAAIVVLAIGGLKGSSETAACKAGAKTIESAEDAYFASSDPNTYTDDGTLLTAGLLKEAPDGLVANGSAGGYHIEGANNKCGSIDITFGTP
jgi:general secretion pathway protein G